MGDVIRGAVLAECRFSGVEHHIETKPRMGEIRLETEAISQWFDKNQQGKAVLNARMHILNEFGPPAERTQPVR
uniref:Uncharacterized protein n=1 Tax=Candidatus Kentrum sp. SD TaxID=2126332 RepID=A0A450YMP7_9GAMM|nr:MAG: hypothetical protein BECKSD772F_GA0070984_10212 [Candidatus Kentron sp. SD]VFK42817.1 MAG: hypothetical protein BECKSD772E_GA0070983_10202 [Candidatus Kentron sp. SD]VFK79352.1 MAG: hypothetical protein BECKSD772D_GA0070982_10465 [Candidatus Kentron sp. SD]